MINNLQQPADLDLLLVQIVQHVLKQLSRGCRTDKHIAAERCYQRICNGRSSWNNSDGEDIAMLWSKHEEMRARSTCGPVEVTVWRNRQRGDAGLFLRDQVVRAIGKTASVDSSLRDDHEVLAWVSLSVGCACDKNCEQERGKALVIVGSPPSDGR